MPRIDSYPTVTPTTSDLLIMSDISATDNPTKTCTVSDIVALGNGGVQPVESVTISITNAQIATLNTAPMIVVPAPGAGKIVLPTGLLVEFTYGAPAISVNTSLQVLQDTALSEGDLGFSNLLAETASIMLFTGRTSPTNAPSAANSKVVTNSPTYIRVRSGNPTMNSSTSTMKVTVFYISHTL